MVENILAQQSGLGSSSLLTLASLGKMANPAVPRQTMM